MKRFLFAASYFGFMLGCVLYVVLLFKVRIVKPQDLFLISIAAGVLHHVWTASEKI